MSYRDFVQSSSGSYRPSPASSISRKPAQTSSLRNVSPASSSHGTSATDEQSMTQPSSISTPQKVVASGSQSPANQYTPSVYATSDAAQQHSLSSEPRYRTLSSTSHQTLDPSQLSSLQAESNTSAPTSTDTMSPASTNLQPLTSAQLNSALAFCHALLISAINEHQKHPFTAALLAPDNATVLATHFSISHYQHAESELARLVAGQYSRAYLSRCTLVSTWEPCAMCAGAIYWTGIGRVVYAAPESRLKEFKGNDNGDVEDLMMNIPCRTVFATGKSGTEVLGPIPEWEERVVQESRKWWMRHRSSTNGTASNGSHSLNGFGSHMASENGSASSKATSITVYNPKDSDYGRVGDDGEYQADLKVDWML